MLDPVINPFETAVRTLYAAAVGEDAALDDSLINGDKASGRLAMASDIHGTVRCLSYVHQDGLRVSEINVRTLALRSVNLAGEK